MKKNLDFILSVPLAYRETKQASAWRHELGEGKVTEQTTLPPLTGHRPQLYMPCYSALRGGCWPGLCCECGLWGCATY